MPKYFEETMKQIPSFQTFPYFRNKTKEKKYFRFLHLFNDNYVIKINFIQPIPYNNYYGLTKIIANCLLSFQVASYLDKISYEYISLLELCDRKPDIEIKLDYKLFHQILLSIKEDLSKFYQSNIYEFEKLPKCEAIHRFIEEISNNNLNCTKMSYRQLNSTNNRNIEKYKSKIIISPKIINTNDAIQYFFKTINNNIECLEQ